MTVPSLLWQLSKLIIHFFLKATECTMREACVVKMLKITTKPWAKKCPVCLKLLKWRCKRVEHLDWGVPLLGAAGLLHSVMRLWWEKLLFRHHNTSIFSFFQFGSFFGRAFVSPPDLNRDRIFLSRLSKRGQAGLESNDKSTWNYTNSSSSDYPYSR